MFFSRRSFLSFLIFTCVGVVHAQQVVPLFRNDTMRTSVTIPFMLQDDDENPMPIMDVEVTSSAANCKAMLDPHITTNFLLKCTQPESALMVTVVFKKSDNKIYKINYAGVPILKLSDTATVVDTVPVDTGTDNLGRQLYETNCAECHGYGSNSAKKGRTKTQIDNAISANKGGMLNSVGFLTSAQRAEIAKYLGSL